MQARDALHRADQHFEDLTVEVSAGKPAAAQDSLLSAQQAARAAHHNTGGPFWWLASKAPVIGANVTAARTVAEVVDHVAQDVLPTLVDASASLSSSHLQPSHGQISLTHIKRLAPLLTTAHTSLTDDVAKVQALKPEALITQIAEPVRELESQLDAATSIASMDSRAADLLPPMLGFEGRRTYLVLFQDNAEIRATGGIFDSVATLTANRGAITLHQQWPRDALGAYTRPIVPLSTHETELFTDGLGRFPADINVTPDFPRTAQIAQAMWKRKTGQIVDGVLSIDRVALSYLLAGTGPITVTGSQQVTAGNAVKILLSGEYLHQPNVKLQDAFFANATKRVFDRVMTGRGDAHAVLDGILKAAAEHRILVWSARAPEDGLLTPTKLSGALPRVATASPQIGVYLNDGTGSKMDYYLGYDVEAQPTACQANGVQGIKVKVTMTSKAPKDAAALPESVRGPEYGAPAGSIRTKMVVYAPIHGKISKPYIDGKLEGYAAFMHNGRHVVRQTVDLAPGVAHTIRFYVTSGHHQAGTPQLQVTPGLPRNTTMEVGTSVCK
jgi:hypothetical protein